MARRLFAYEVPDEALTFLIATSLSGTSERQLAAKLLLECLRRYRSSDDVQKCLDEVARSSILEVAPEAKRLATMIGILKQTGTSH
jgi:hypothetical protein